MGSHTAGCPRWWAPFVYMSYVDMSAVYLPRDPRVVPPVRACFGMSQSPEHGSTPLGTHLPFWPLLDPRVVPPVRACFGMSHSPEHGSTPSFGPHLLSV